MSKQQGRAENSGRGSLQVNRGGARPNRVVACDLKPSMHAGRQGAGGQGSVGGGALVPKSCCPGWLVSNEAGRLGRGGGGRSRARQTRQYGHPVASLGGLPPACRQGTRVPAASGAATATARACQEGRRILC